MDHKAVFLKLQTRADLDTLSAYSTISTVAYRGFDIEVKTCMPFHCKSTLSKTTYICSAVITLYSIILTSYLTFVIVGFVLFYFTSPGGGIGNNVDFLRLNPDFAGTTGVVVEYLRVLNLWPVSQQVIASCQKNEREKYLAQFQEITKVQNIKNTKLNYIRWLISHTLMLNLVINVIVFIFAWDDLSKNARYVLVLQTVTDYVAGGSDFFFFEPKFEPAGLLQTVKNSFN
eukprot:UN27949